MKKKVVIAMSGGVDSSTAACLLCEQGYEVIGVTMKFPSFSAEGLKNCCGVQGIEDARAVAGRLNIPYYVLNYEKEVEDTVVKYFCGEYLSGRTPNPCIVCNREIKFGSLLAKARSLGAEYIATGHYARIEQTSGRYLLKKGVDIKKEQSYFLFALSGQQLASILFPLGGYTKQEVRSLAREHGLKVHDKPGSQEICFLGDTDYRDFLKSRYDAAIFRLGDIVDKKGGKLGRHEGVVFYTVGQRKGVGSRGRPYYVTGIDIEKNTVIIGEEADIYRDELLAERCNWTAVDGTEAKLDVKASIRYNHKPAEAEVFPEEGNKARVKFKEPQRAVTPGQAVVFYREDIVVGGGWIS